MAVLLCRIAVDGSSVPVDRPFCCQSAAVLRTAASHAATAEQPAGASVRDEFVLRTAAPAALRAALPSLPSADASSSEEAEEAGEVAAGKADETRLATRAAPRAAAARPAAAATSHACVTGAGAGAERCGTKARQENP
ncbi:uncharacterized protein LOC113147159 [Cyclospora cayetanensis]|uniref:Uncharacterized protein LOC113147159 n=1 Tax=Cyclospora cayetanensis TaxID=88456 RepID=A0A6P6RX95_9EIME|nr:uncharacterized protein LOC113147159 [Cyclospora cayetanensis]